MLLNSIESLRLFMENDEVDKANVMLNYVLEDLQRVKGATLPKLAKDSIIKKIEKIPSFEILNRADEFIQALRGYPEKPHRKSH